MKQLIRTKTETERTFVFSKDEIEEILLAHIVANKQTYEEVVESTIDESSEYHLDGYTIILKLKSVRIIEK